MPPRFAYWTIIVDGSPTAFRAAEKEELLPTFRRLQQKSTSAELRWFSRGKLWDSPEHARDVRDRESMERASEAQEKSDSAWREAIAELRRKRREREGEAGGGAHGAGEGAGAGEPAKAPRERKPPDLAPRERKAPGWAPREQKPPDWVPREQKPPDWVPRERKAPGWAPRERASTAWEPRARVRDGRERPDRERGGWTPREPGRAGTGSKTENPRPPRERGAGGGPGDRDAAWREAIAELRRKRLAQSGTAGTPPEPPDRGGKPSEAPFRKKPRASASRSERAGAAPDDDRKRSPERRGKDWRPGGDHRDPRDKYKGKPGERRKKWKARFFAKDRPGGGSGPKPSGSSGSRGPKPFEDGYRGPKAIEHREARKFGKGPGGFSSHGPRAGSGTPGGGPRTGFGKPGGAGPKAGFHKPGARPKTGFGKPSGAGPKAGFHKPGARPKAGFGKKGLGSGRGPKPAGRGGKPPGRRRG